MHLEEGNAKQPTQSWACAVDDIVKSPLFWRLAYQFKSGQDHTSWCSLERKNMTSQHLRSAIDEVFCQHSMNFWSHPVSMKVPDRFSCTRQPQKLNKAKWGPLCFSREPWATQQDCKVSWGITRSRLTSNSLLRHAISRWSDAFYGNCKDQENPAEQ